MYKKKQVDILKGNMYNLIITLSLPIMINNLIQTLYNLVDGVWVSKIGSVPFAATSFVWPVNFLFISIGSGLSIAATSLLSQYVGADQKEKADKYATQLLALAVVAGVIFSVIGFIISPYVIRLMGAPHELIEYGNIYLRISLLDMPFMFFYFIFSSMMHAQGNTVTPTLLSGISAIINIVLDPIFIFTLNMGIAGAAWATILSRVLLALAGMYILASKKTVIRPSFRGFKFDKKIISRCMKVALPSSIGQSGSAVGFMVLNSFIASYGTATLAAFGMVNRITSLVSQPAMGIGAALVAIAGQNIGANQLDRAKEGFKKSFILTSIIGLIGCFVLLWQDRAIINFFMQAKDDYQVIEQAITFLGYIAYSMPLMGIFSVLTGVFQGSGYTKYAMAMEVGRLWFIRLPMILVFKHLTTIGPVGIWFSMSFSNLIICLYGLSIYKKGKWTQKIG